MTVVADGVAAIGAGGDLPTPVAFITGATDRARGTMPVTEELPRRATVALVATWTRTSGAITMTCGAGGVVASSAVNVYEGAICTGRTG